MSPSTLHALSIPVDLWIAFCSLLILELKEKQTLGIHVFEVRSEMTKQKLDERHREVLTASSLSDTEQQNLECYGPHKQERGQPISNGSTQ